MLVASAVLTALVLFFGASVAWSSRSPELVIGLLGYVATGALILRLARSSQNDGVRLTLVRVWGCLSLSIGMFIKADTGNTLASVIRFVTGR
jgi:hypothetical protein